MDANSNGSCVVAPSAGSSADPLAWLYQDDTEIVEGEREAEWLRAVGLGDAAAQYENGQLIDHQEMRRQLSFLTRNQREAVRRRVATLNRTIRKRRRAVRSEVDLYIPGSIDTSSADAEEDARRRQHMSLNFPLDATFHSTDLSDSGEYQHPAASTTTGIQRSSVPTSAFSASQREWTNYVDQNAAGTPQMSINPIHRTSLQQYETEPRRPGQLNQPRYVSGDSTDNALVESDSDKLALEDLEDDFEYVDEDENDEFLNASRDESSIGVDNSVPNEGTEQVFSAWAKARNGVSVVYDLSRPDMEKISSLALIELTALFDKHRVMDITAPKKISKASRPKDQGIFGRSLAALVEEEQKRDQFLYVMAPRFFVELLRHLWALVTEDGILRHAGNAARIRNLRASIDQTYALKPFNWAEVKAHDAASLLKQYMRELATPLLTHEYVHLWTQVPLLDNKEDQVQALNLLVLLLPIAHSHTLKLLVLYLAEVVRHAETNRMTLENVCVIMAPNLFPTPPLSRPGGGSNGANHQIHMELASAETQSEVLRLLITYHQHLWIVPDFIMCELRLKDFIETAQRARRSSITGASSGVEGCLHEKQMLSPVLRFLGLKKGSGPPGGQTGARVDYPDSAGAVYVPHQIYVKLSHMDDKVFVDTEMCRTVRDVIQYVQQTTVSSRMSINQPPPENHDGWTKTLTGSPAKKLCLFEVGGNITRRCLSDENALMENLLALNPSAEWVIQFR